MHVAKEVVSCLEMSDACGDNRVGEGQSGKAAKICVSAEVDVNDTADGGG
jgi:hypothetical protein